MGSHFGSLNPDGLPNFQKAIAGVKIHYIEDILILLEIFWDIDV
jgi:hypothetical protein